MVNFARNPSRRFQFDVGVGTTDDLIEATGLAEDTMTRMEGVMEPRNPGLRPRWSGRDLGRTGARNILPDRFIERQIAQEQGHKQDLLDARAAKE